MTQVLVRDSRTCFQCGARIDRCEHTRGQLDEYMIEAAMEREHKPIRAWTYAERATLIRYKTRGLSYSEIADAMNRTFYSVSQKGREMRL